MLCLFCYLQIWYSFSIFFQLQLFQGNHNLLSACSAKCNQEIPYTLGKTCKGTHRHVCIMHQSAACHLLNHMHTEKHLRQQDTEKFLVSRMLMHCWFEIVSTPPPPTPFNFVSVLLLFLQQQLLLQLLLLLSIVWLVGQEVCWFQLFSLSSRPGKADVLQPDVGFLNICFH